MSNEEAIKEFDARSVELVCEFCKSGERKLSEVASTQASDEAAEHLYDFRHEIDRFIVDLERRTEIRDGVSDVAFIAKQQLALAVAFAQPERIEKLLRVEALREEMPWLSAVDAIREGRPHDQLTEYRYGVCLKIVAALKAESDAKAKT